MSSTLVLTSLPRMTPTIWSHMRLCRLRGVFASKHAAEAWVLHDPRGWLGTAFHRVMQASARPGASADDAEMAWRSSVADAATKHSLDFRFGAAERWPGYFLVRHRALASAAQVRAKAQTRNGAKRNASKAARGTERRIETRDGRYALSRRSVQRFGNGSKNGACQTSQWRLLWKWYA